MPRLDIRRRAEVLAWTQLWLLGSYEGHTLLAIPRLALSHETTLNLTARLPYHKAFEGATVDLHGAYRQFVVVHATFEMYKTSEPEIRGFAALVPDITRPLPPPGVVIEKTAAMLRGT